MDPPPFHQHTVAFFVHSGRARQPVLPTLWLLVHLCDYVFCLQDANTVVKYAPPTPAQCKEWNAAQEAADKEAQAKGKP